MVVLSPASVPWRGIRNTDQYGSGKFWASRDAGARPHMGVDYIALVGDDFISPLDGKVTHIGVAYADSDLGSVRIAGRGIEVRILYVESNVKEGTTVSRGQRIGTVQDVTKRYPGITPHIHVEVWVADDPQVHIEAPKS